MHGVYLKSLSFLRGLPLPVNILHGDGSKCARWFQKCPLTPPPPRCVEKALSPVSKCRLYTDHCRVCTSVLFNVKPTFSDSLHFIAFSL